MSPTYDWSGEASIKLGDVVARPGERAATTQYFTDANLNLVSHLPQVDAPIKTIYNADITVNGNESAVVDQNYERIAIYNNCGGVLQIYTNNDSDNIIPMVDESFWILDNRKHDIGAIYMSGESAGPVKISLDKNIL